VGWPREQPKREHRIVEEIIVDAYDSVERAMSWCYYLEVKLRMPFAASCMAKRQSSPLEIGERVEVIGMASEDECMSEIPVFVTRSKTRLAVPRGRLKCHARDEQHARLWRTGGIGWREAAPIDAVGAARNE
jgi:hypothetical protein